MRRLQTTFMPFFACVLALLLSACASMPHDDSPPVGMESPQLSGNKVTLLFDGPQTTTAMEAAILAAKSTIHLETYIFDQDEIGQRFADLLIQQQKAGVKVRIIYDSVGTIGTPDEFFERLRAAGIELLAFNPVNPFKLHGPWQPNNRDHRKILVVDGLVAFTGGVNITANYSNGSLFHRRKREGKPVGWRDTHLQIQGPAVAVLQSVFLQTWNNQAVRPVVGPEAFPKLAPAGNKGVRVLASVPGGAQEIYTAYLTAIREAKSRIYLTCSYFIPDKAMLDALLDAAKRGVDVKIILPGVQEGGMVFYAGHAYFDTMLSGGIQLYQMHEAVLHAKTAVIDGRWSTVGSANMDTRSFLHNSEINVIVIDDAFGASMESAFSEDLSDSEQVILDVWRQRPMSERLKEWASSQFDYWL